MQLDRRRTSISKFFASSPLRGMDLELERDRDLDRSKSPNLSARPENLRALQLSLALSSDKGERE
jgi:hypothetical protein